MPEDSDLAKNDPGKLLRGGEFYSRVESRLHTDEAVLCELIQPCGRAVPRHEHALAYITVVLNGSYLEGDQGQLDELQPFVAVYNPSGVTHRTVIGPKGASFFTIELREQHLQALDLRLPRETIFDRGAGSMLWPGLRLYSAFKSGHTGPLLMESHLLEAMSAVCGLASAPKSGPGSPIREKQTPRWFHRVKDRLHHEFTENLRMRDLAHDAGVHPVHLARVFRDLERQTPGDYLQRLRVRAACDMLRSPEQPLAGIAADCGFADQSHFTRVFKKMAGSTPAQFRRSLSVARLSGGAAATDSHGFHG